MTPNKTAGGVSGNPPGGKTAGGTSGSPRAAKPVASLTDKPVGAKTTDELIRKIAQAYEAHDSAAYLKIVKAPLRERMQMQIQFVRDGHNVVRNFKYLTVAQEVARMGAAPGAASMGKDKIVNGVKSTYSLPVVGYVDFDVKSSPEAEPIVAGVPVGQADGKYFLVSRITAPVKP
jgi:hypothetical protein